MNAAFRRLAGCLVLLAQVATAQTRLPPADQATKVPDFFAFRAQLQTAIARHDHHAVVSALHKDVKLSFGGDTGIADFNALWRPSAPDSPLWAVLGNTLALGGTFAPDGSFTAPYLFSQWPNSRDAFTSMVAVGTNIRVHQTPSASAPVIAKLDFSIVELAGTAPPNESWTAVKLPSGQTGFVEAKYLRSPIDYRVRFAKHDGRWQIVLFLAGD